jgi:ribosome-associated protein
MPPRTYINDPPSADLETEEDLRSRGDERRANQEVETALARLASDLVEQSATRLQRLGLPDPVLDAVLDARTIKSFAARKRQLRVVRGALRSSDWSIIRARLDALVRHGTIPGALALTESTAPSPAAQAQQWVVRLLGEGAEAIEALLKLCPTADRSHLRTLVRQVEKGELERKKKAEARLAAAVESLLRGI